MRLEFDLPDLAPWRRQQRGLPPGVLQLEADRPGPHVALFALVHGNEPSGAVALQRLLELAIRPARGRLSLCLANPDAFDRFDPALPAAARYLDEDFNRIWDDARLDAPGSSRERLRARALRPLVRQVDFLLDLHSMQLAGEPLLLCADVPRAARFAAALGFPGTVVLDPGHATGRRLIDYAPFAHPAGRAVALLLEAGAHGARATVETALATTLRFLATCGVLEAADRARYGLGRRRPTARFVRVERAVRVERGPFRLLGEPTSLAIVPRAGTTIGFDAGVPVRTPFDECALVLPTPQAPPGHTAVRLGRRIAPPDPAAAEVRPRPAVRGWRSAVRR